MGTLVKAEEMIRHLDIKGEGDQKNILDAWIDGLEDALAEMTRQVFSTVTTEISQEEHEPTARNWLWLDRPASALGNIEYGQDPSDPAGTLDGTDPTEVFIDPRNPRKIRRAYGAPFWKGTRWFVTYTPIANTPAAAKAAIREAVAFLWRRMGSEDAEQERVGEFSHKLIDDLNRVPAWKSYVERKAAPIAR
jgi:hypothetical protein